MQPWECLVNFATALGFILVVYNLISLYLFCTGLVSAGLVRNTCTFQIMCFVRWLRVGEACNCE